MAAKSIMDETFENRKQESDRVKCKYVNRIPVIVLKDKRSTMLDIDKNKFLVPKDMSITKFMYIVRKRIKVKPEEALFILVNGELINGNKLMGDIYENKKDEDGFLYMTYTSENTFG